MAAVRTASADEDRPSLTCRGRWHGRAARTRSRRPPNRSTPNRTTPPPATSCPASPTRAHTRAEAAHSLAQPRMCRTTRARATPLHTTPPPPPTHTARCARPTPSPQSRRAFRPSLPAHEVHDRRASGYSDDDATLHPQMGPPTAQANDSQPVPLRDTHLCPLSVGKVRRWGFLVRKRSGRKRRILTALPRSGWRRSSC